MGQDKPRIVILTGAGISAECGLGTFRDTDGIWSRYDLREVATPEGFARNPALVHDFYNARRANARGADPNAAHFALARLATALPGQVTLITQNVDDLHERAGSPDVIHMHGELMKALCARCGARWPAPDNMQTREPCPDCGANATRPDVVWFGELPYQMERIEAALAKTGLFAAIGTSGQVWPAAGFVDLAKEAGADTVELNLDPSEMARAFDRQIPGPASRTVPLWADDLAAALGHR